MKPFRFVDLFCGGGGSVTGAINALKAAEVKYEGRCFNHWDLAIKTIQMNHPEMVPDFERACADIAEVSGCSPKENWLRQQDSRQIISLPVVIQRQRK